MFISIESSVIHILLGIQSIVAFQTSFSNYNRVKPLQIKMKYDSNYESDLQRSHLESFNQNSCVSGTVRSKSIFPLLMLSSLLWTSDSANAFETKNNIANILDADILEQTNTFLTSSLQNSLVLNKSIFINGFICGAVINAAKNLILHPIETLKTRLDTGMKGNIFADVYSGIVPALIGGIPAAAVFFGTKDLFRSIFRQYSFIDPKFATILAVTLAQFPYWLLRNPSEVIKTRLRTTSTENSTSTSSSLQDILQRNTITDYYTGLIPNLLYALPSDWLKFIAYDLISYSLFNIHESESVTVIQALICGALASLVAETICTPLDVVRTRIMCVDGSCELLPDDTKGTVMDRKLKQKQNISMKKDDTPATTAPDTSKRTSNSEILQ
eukprot:gene11794-24710_t